VTPGREPQWRSYARQHDNVFFSHVTHMKLGKLACEKCHGNIGTTDKLPLHYEDPISGYSRQTMSMDACIACHRENKLNHSCMDCHK